MYIYIYIWKRWNKFCWSNQPSPYDVALTAKWAVVRVLGAKICKKYSCSLNGPSLLTRLHWKRPGHSRGAAGIWGIEILAAPVSPVLCRETGVPTSKDNTERGSVQLRGQGFDKHKAFRIRRVSTEIFPVTWHIQVFQVWAQWHDIKDRLIGDVVTARHLQPPQFWTALGNGVESSVCEPPAATNNYRLQHETYVGCILTKPPGQHFKSPVYVDCLAGQANSPPKSRVPGKVVPAAAHTGAAAQLVGGQEGEYLDHGVVGQPVYVGLFLLVLGCQPDEGMSETGWRRRVDHGNSFPSDWGWRRRRPSAILETGGIRWKY